MSQSLKKSRVLLKLSGEFFQGHSDFGFDFPEIKKLAERIVESCSDSELALVIGSPVLLILAVVWFWPS